MNSTKLSAFCDRVIEVGWLAAVIVTPLFFNTYSSRIFDPDKITVLRSIALVMAAVWMVKLVVMTIQIRGIPWNILLYIMKLKR